MPALPRAAALLLLLPSALLACIWDSDTLRYEASGMPGLLEIMTGRVDRPPPLYYQMRLDRVTNALAANPDDLNAYDDAGASCDRLGRGDDAVEWMARKKAALDRLGAAVPDDHLYRYHANIGTFLAHRWLRTGADRDRMDDMLAGRDHIAQAIRINPDAHFGRERVQLLAMDWIIKAPDSGTSSLCQIFDADDSPGAPVARGYNTGPQTKAIEGLSGLIVLGAAWDSFDVFAALTIALSNQGDTYLAQIASNRAGEIANAGGRSLHPANIPYPSDAIALPQHLRNALYSSRGMAQRHGEDELDAFYLHAREEAELWRTERNDFMLAKLQQGKHPDTDPDFWTGYTERPAPTPPGTLIKLTPARRAALDLAPIILGPLGIWYLIRRVRARRAARLA